MSTDTPRCKEEVMPATGFPRPHRCHFKASKDGYCKIHHPDSVKAREEKQRIKYESDRAKSPYMLLQKANERNQQLERELTAEQEKCKRLREALQMVVSVSDKFCADNNVKIESDCVTNARATLEATK